MFRPALTIVLLVLALIVSGGASTAQTKLTVEQETRAKVLFLQLRCVVCQNQSIGDSDADVAKDLREIVREQIAGGKSDAQIREFLVARYGEFILLKPVFAWHTALLWGAPIFLLLIGGLLAWRVTTHRSKASIAPVLSAEDEAEVQKIISEHRS